MGRSKNRNGAWDISKEPFPKWKSPPCQSATTLLGQLLESITHPAGTLLSNRRRGGWAHWPGSDRGHPTLGSYPPTHFFSEDLFEPWLQRIIWWGKSSNGFPSVRFSSSGISEHGRCKQGMRALCRLKTRTLGLQFNTVWHFVTDSKAAFKIPSGGVGFPLAFPSNRAWLPWREPGLWDSIPCGDHQDSVALGVQKLREGRCAQEVPEEALTVLAASPEV